MADPKTPESTPEPKSDKPKTIKVEVLCETLVHSGEIYAKGATVTDTEEALRSALESKDVEPIK